MTETTAVDPFDEVYEDTPEAETPAPAAVEHLVWSEGRWREMESADMQAIRRSHTFQKLRADFRAICEIRKEPCWLCTAEIDYRLPYPHPDCWSLDHAKPVRDHPELILDVANFRASHLDCNVRRGSDEPKLDLGTPSEIW